jgi:hypothetical protein
MNTVKIELDVKDAQELLAYLEKQESKLYWVLENRDPGNKKLEIIAKNLKKFASPIKRALNERAKVNVVTIVHRAAKK